MARRNESCVYHQATYRLGPAQNWLADFNRCHLPRATLFHLFAYAAVCTLQCRPRLNRFVSGGRIYQRREVTFAFVAKTSRSDPGADAAVKIRARPAEPFAAFSSRMVQEIRAPRVATRALDREVNWIMRLPGPLVTALVKLARILDRWNLYPNGMIEHDPLFSSIFLANLGSFGLSDTFHHLYEYGTTSLFAALSEARPTLFPAPDGAAVAPGLDIRFTFDERINDGLTSARALAMIRQAFEDPLGWLGPPEGDPTWNEPAEPVGRPPTSPSGS